MEKEHNFHVQLYKHVGAYVFIVITFIIFKFLEVQWQKGQDSPVGELVSDNNGKGSSNSNNNKKHYTGKNGKRSKVE